MGFVVCVRITLAGSALQVHALRLRAGFAIRFDMLTEKMQMNPMIYKVYLYTYLYVQPCISLAQRLSPEGLHVHRPEPAVVDAGSTCKVDGT